MGMNIFDSEIGWKKRLAIVLSFLWLAIFVAIGASERDGVTLFFALGVFPLAALWGIAWVWWAYRRQKTPNNDVAPPPLVVKNETASEVDDGAGLARPDAVVSSKSFASGIAQPQIPSAINGEPEILSFPLATPWPRAFARIFDIWWESILIGGAAGFLLGQYSSAYLHWANQPNSDYLFGLVLLPFVLLFDAVVFRFTGNTPGKAMLGIRVASLRGTPLEFGQYLRRNLTLWWSGLALGIPLANLFTLWRQEKRLRNGQQTSYDEEIGSRVWSKPISWGRKLGFAVTFFLLFAVNAGLTTLSKEADREAAKVAVAKTYTWVNPVTQISATIAPQWKYSSVDNGDGQKIETFTERTEHAMVILGVEYADALALHDYATAFQQSNAKTMSFVDGGQFSEQGGKAYWDATGTMLDVAGVRLHVRVTKVDGAYWRQVTIQSKPFDFTDPLLEPLQSALWRTIL